MVHELPGSAGTTLRQIGHDMIQSVVALCVESVVWGIYLVLVMISSVTLFRKRRSRIACFLLITVLLMLVLDTAMYILDITNAVQEISLTLTSDTSLSLPDRYALTGTLPWPVQSALYAFLSNLGDVIIIWRVHAFYSLGRERYVLLLPLLLLAASFATSGAISFCAAHHLVTDRGGAVVVAGNFVDPPFCRNVQMTSYVTTLATTGVATLLISYKTWEYRRTISGLLWRREGESRKSKVEKTMFVLVESGVLYFLFFLEAVISDTPRVARLENSSNGLAFASLIWTYLTSHIVCIYPVVVIIIVHSQRSFIDAATTWREGVFVNATMGTDELRFGSTNVDIPPFLHDDERRSGSFERSSSITEVCKSDGVLGLEPPDAREREGKEGDIV